MGFPYDLAIVINNRHAAMGVHGQEVRIVQPARRAACCNMPVLKPQFADQPKHLLDIKGAAASPDFKHAI